MKVSLCPPLIRRPTRSGAIDAVANNNAIAGSENGTLAISGKPSGASTPDAEDARANDFVTQVLEIHGKLRHLDSLAPCPVVNESLSKLVGMCCEIIPSSTVDKILRNHSLQAILPSLRTICDTAECELEAHWAARINNAFPTAAPNPDEVLAQLRRFPHFSNYTELTRLELCAMCAVEPRRPRRIAFIGSGPLPLTSWTLIRALGSGVLTPEQFDAEFNVFHSGRQTDAGQQDDAVTVLNVDINADAIETSRTLSARLGRHGRGMEFCVADAGDWSIDLTSFDVVYLASLVGLTAEDKETKLAGIVAKMRPGALIVARSCSDLKRVLYPEVDLQTATLLERLEVCAIMHPYGQVLNSAVIARIK